MDVKLEDYLSEEEIKDTLRQALRDQFENYVGFK